MAPERTTTTTTTIALPSELAPFQDQNFQVKQFLESLTHRLLTQAQNDTTKFDPRPFVKALEGSTAELAKLRRLAVRKMGDLEDASQAIQSSRQGQALQLGTQFEDTYEEFHQLEARISEVGNTAILIGEQLESIDKQRIRAVEAKDLVMYFQEFNQENTARLDLLRSSDTHATFSPTTGSQAAEDIGGSSGRRWEGRAKAAKIVKRLAAMSKEMDLAVVSKARTTIEKYSESVEKEMLDEFDQAYKDGDLDTMATCANILMDFNGGQSCIQAYINQHEFFTTRMKLFEMETSMKTATGPSASSSPSKQSEYEMDIPGLDGVLDRLYKEVRATVQREWSMISTVFPNASAVMQQFIQRIFAQSIQIYVETLLKQAEETSVLSYLRTLASFYAATLSLEQDLKQFLESVLQDSPATLQSLLNAIARCREDLFVPYLDNDKYMERETECLQLAMQQLLTPFADFQLARKVRAKNQGMFSKTLTGAFSEPSPGTTGGPSLSQSFSNQPMTLETCVNVQMMSRLIRVHKECMQRCKALSALSEVARNACILVGLFLESAGKKYVDICLDLYAYTGCVRQGDSASTLMYCSAIEDLLAMETKLEPELRFFHIVHMTDCVVHNLQNYFQATIVPLISAQPTIHRETVIKKNQLMTTLESKVNVMIHKLVDAVVNWLSVILGRQKKGDYRPKENDLSAMAHQSNSACAQCCDYFQKMYVILSRCLDGKNLESVLTEICIQFHGLLLEYVKKFVISVSGGFLLSKDLARVQDTLKQFKIPAVDVRFEMLRQLANIYVVLPENLKPLLEEGLFSRLDARVLHSFVLRRADYRQAKLGSLFHGVISPEEAESMAADASMSVWEKGLENAVVAVGDVGEGIRKMLLSE